MANRFHLSSGGAQEWANSNPTLAQGELKYPDAWGDINFWGNELTLHSSEEFEKPEAKRHNVDMGNVTVPHFGVHISAEDFKQLKQRIADNNIEYIDPPYIRFEGTKLEQETMFIADPYGNAMEIKTMKNPETLWEKQK